MGRNLKSDHLTYQRPHEFMLKYLRIVVTALSLTACVLLVALWVRSYWVCDIVYRMNPSMVETIIGATSGKVYFVRIDVGATGVPYKVHGWEYLRAKTADVDVSKLRLSKLQSKSTVRSVNVHLPYWLVTLSCAVLAAFPWIQYAKRFSLRTLLIATTLVAMGLGIIAVMS
jgi:hypothetical protein